MCDIFDFAGRGVLAPEFALAETCVCYDLSFGLRLVGKAKGEEVGKGRGVPGLSLANLRTAWPKMGPLPVSGRAMKSA